MPNEGAIGFEGIGEERGWAERPRCLRGGGGGRRGGEGAGVRGGMFSGAEEEVGVEQEVEGDGEVADVFVEEGGKAGGLDERFEVVAEEAGGVVGEVGEVAEVFFKLGEGAGEAEGFDDQGVEEEGGVQGEEAGVFEEQQSAEEDVEDEEEVEGDDGVDG